MEATGSIEADAWASWLHTGVGGSATIRCDRKHRRMRFRCAVRKTVGRTSAVFILDEVNLMYLKIPRRF